MLATNEQYTAFFQAHVALVVTALRFRLGRDKSTGAAGGAITS